MAKIGINGFGRIGRAAFKIALDTPGLEVAAVNDLVDADNLAYLLRYDTVYGRYDRDVSVDNGRLVVDGERYPVLNERDPANLPWEELGVDIALECTGVFRTGEDLEKHLNAGAKYAILSAPARSEDVGTVVHGTSQPDGQQRVVSCASCTTNSITPVIEVLGRRVGVQKAIMSTVHGYTASQQLVDGPKRDRRRGRAAAENLIPTSTGAAVATSRVLPQFEGKFDGVAIRVPVPSGSIADIICLTERDTSVEEVNGIFREEADTDRYRGILGVTDEPLVSTDILQDPRASIVDLGMTQVVDGNLVRVMSWYDNEWGYASQLIREAEGIAANL